LFIWAVSKREEKKEKRQARQATHVIKVLVHARQDKVDQRINQGVDECLQGFTLKRRDTSNEDNSDSARATALALRTTILSDIALLFV
jgi:primosomal replication protein N